MPILQLIFLCGLFSSVRAEQGPIIAFSGLSGSGKSTIAKIISRNMNSFCLSEPEECDWPAIITDRAAYGPAMAMLEFRQIWAKMFLDAARSSKDGRMVFIDTYFFKIFGYYLDKVGMEWLVPRNDPYLRILLQLNQFDQISSRMQPVWCFLTLPWMIGSYF